MTQRMVVGFLFVRNAYRCDVALIKKSKPWWQRGKYNGIGGKVEDGESFAQAMTREFQEEADVLIVDWKLFLTLTHTGRVWDICFYKYFVDRDPGVKTMTDENIIWTPLEVINWQNTYIMSNLAWIIPLALDGDVTQAIVQDKSLYDMVNEVKIA